MTLFFASCYCAGVYSSAGRHIPGCPMDSNCCFCGQKPFLCRMMGKCSGIAKVSKTLVLRDRALQKMMGQLSNKLSEILAKLILLINMGQISQELVDRIDALKYAFSKKLRLDPESLESAEKILFQLRRIYVTQKAAHVKNLKEKEATALAECAAADFVPTRSY
jgi:hypothetical protein